MSSNYEVLIIFENYIAKFVYSECGNNNYNTIQT